MAGLFQVLWGRKDGTFSKPEELKGTDGEPLIIPAEEEKITDSICTRPFAIDWNNDGVLDLVVGNFTGTFYVFAGKAPGKFLPKPTLLTVGGHPLKISGAHSDPFVIDFDGDGDLDILSGSSSGGVQWSENQADPGKPPKMARFVWLIKAQSQAQMGAMLQEDSLTGPAISTRVWVDDVNGDGKLDVLVGDNVTLSSYADGWSKEQLDAKLADWKKKYDATIAKWREASKEKDQDAQQAASKKLSALMTRRRDFIRQEMTGFVWLYLQK